ncbi:sulfite exporter TauE/SafE family protein [Noviherbaspirillum cavernae]|uniref:Probable membrane transporter protein n=2 Tax=Noviherbaspirillum cavernae TaxID=2320862 RepID=A0A418WWL4_9BURK|nr:sulfite exporter TauE/SafE family protein [Noviherbaspirillum cavernae]
MAGFMVVMATFLLAGLVKGVIGLGLPTVAVALLGLVMTPMEAAALLVVPSLVTNVWQLAAGTNLKRLMHRLWPMMAGICIGTMLGAALWSGSDARHATAALGVALILYALSGLLSIRLSFPAGSEPWLSPTVGAATGAVTAATGVFVMPAVPYLQALGFSREDLIQAMGLAFTTSTVALAAGFAYQGSLHSGTAGGSLLALLPALAGMHIGQWVRTVVRPETFRKCFFAGLLAIGMHLALKGLF